MSDFGKVNMIYFVYQHSRKRNIGSIILNHARKCILELFIGRSNVRKIIHVDMDCFFAAVEMRNNPALKEFPLAITGQRLKHEVVITANYLARKFGVCSSMPTVLARRLCPNLVLLPSLSSYKEISVHIQEIFSRYAKLIEPFSLDEAYLDVTDSQKSYQSASLLAEEIRQTIFRELNLTASAGIAPVKFLAKIASDLNKPNGQYVITPSQVSAFLKTLPLDKIPGVGKVFSKKLENMGLHTCEDVQKSNLFVLLKRFGKFGGILWERSQGIDKRPVSSIKSRKSLGVEHTLARDIYRWEDCKKIIICHLYPRLEHRLSKEKPDFLIARQGIKLKFNDFQQTIQQHLCSKLNKNDLLEIAKDMWEVRRFGRGVRLVGLRVALVDTRCNYQLTLGF